MRARHQITRYHCCPQKTASRWVKSLFQGVVKGHVCINPGVDFITAASIHSHDVSAWTSADLISPLYINYDDFLSLVGDSDYRAIWITRDMRDIFVSRFFSIAYSHTLINEQHGRLRQQLQDMPIGEAMAYFFEKIEPVDRQTPMIKAMRSWLKSEGNSRVITVRYEDLTGAESLAYCRDIFRHFEIGVPLQSLRTWLDANRFEKLTGRAPGEVDINNHLRSGKPGDWKNHFDDRLFALCQEHISDILAGYGYESQRAFPL